jgi:ATP phosphoribosyltransferase regulatory subunit
MVGLGSELSASGEFSQKEQETLLETVQRRGGPGLIAEVRGTGGARFGAVLDRLEQTCEAIGSRGVSDRIRVDFSMLRDLGYYSGSILEVYDPSVGEAIGGGGRYDGLMSRFGLEQPAAGFSLYLELIHKAQLEQGSRGTGPVGAAGSGGGEDG